MTLPLHTYVSEVEAITSELSRVEAFEMLEARWRGKKPAEIAEWILLFRASPPVVPLLPGDARSKNPLQVHESLEGEDFKIKEPTP